MRNYHLTKEEGRLVEQALKDLYQSLFGSVYFPRYISAFMVALSISMAIFFAHEGWFPTSQSQGMTHYHRWIYDVYVVTSIFIVPLIYLRFKQLHKTVTFRRKWNAYIRAYAEHQFKLKQIVENSDSESSGQQKLNDSSLTYFLKNKWFQYVIIGICIYGSIAMYIWVTPFVGSRGSSFWILTWWPINALIIGLLYYAQFPLFLRLLSIEEVNRYYQVLNQKASRDNSVNTVEKIQN